MRPPGANHAQIEAMAGGVEPGVRDENVATAQPLLAEFISKLLTLEEQPKSARKTHERYHRPHHASCSTRLIAAIICWKSESSTASGFCPAATACRSVRIRWSPSSFTPLPPTLGQQPLQRRTQRALLRSPRVSWSPARSHSDASLPWFLSCLVR